ncbi:enoyl-CoA hydratase-related protein [Streptomyces sp. NPDC088921]|uniref:enoyl-CoA hydratase/isomerase family protein n=1 Tax=unclassified Streptomyces TaxID=2593676 RepID=UPI0034393B08
MASTAARFPCPQLRQGVIRVHDGARLGARVPMGAALELLLTGDPVDAQRALELGLVNRVVSPDAVESTGFTPARGSPKAPSTDLPPPGSRTPRRHHPFTGGGPARGPAGAWGRS